MVAHLNARDVTLICVSHSPLSKLQPYQRRMGWKFTYASSSSSEFKMDFGAFFTEARQREVAATVLEQFANDDDIAEVAASCGTDLAGYVTIEAPRLSAFAIDDGVVYQTSTTPPDFGLELGYEQFLDRAPFGAKEGVRMRRHDAYNGVAGGARH
jgi:predicted dithiol-disulfide oxidoreductase (DUF899 family)